jgi:predicted GNAT superfamily acetyltransferase
MKHNNSDIPYSAKFHDNLITYSDEKMPQVEDVIELYNNAGLERPTMDKSRIKTMLHHSNLIVTAWDGDLLVGLSRSLTDWVWICYLADLAVRTGYKNSGIGKQLISLTKGKVSDQSTLLLISVPTAMEYYPKMGFEKLSCGFVCWRNK